MWKLTRTLLVGTMIESEPQSSDLPSTGTIAVLHPACNHQSPVNKMLVGHIFPHNCKKIAIKLKWQRGANYWTISRYLHTFISMESFKCIWKIKLQKGKLRLEQSKWRTCRSYLCSRCNDLNRPSSEAVLAHLKHATRMMNPLQKLLKIQTHWLFIAFIFLYICRQ